VKPNSKDSGTQSKFVPICHHCGKVGHSRPKCYLLKSHRPWKKQEDSRKGFIEKTSSNKYVLPYRRHISQRGKDFVICENANLKFVEPFTVLRFDINSLGSENRAKDRDSPSCRHCGKYGHIKAECFKVKPHKPKKNQTNEGLVNMMKNVLVRLINCVSFCVDCILLDKITSM
jgi:hypothetical protein